MRPEHGGVIDQQGLIDFSVNLNQTIPPISDAEWLSWKSKITQYPPATANTIEQKLAQYLNISRENLLCTSGGTEALHSAIQLFAGNDILLPAPCFSEYLHIAEQNTLTPQLTTVNSSQWSNTSAWLDLPYSKNATIILANPNNPTGVLLNKKELLGKIKQTEADNINWIIDEAFIDFTYRGESHSLIQELDSHPNLIIAGSLTKTWNIPGLRLGYLATANKDWMMALRKRQLTWPLNGIIYQWADNYLLPEKYRQNLEQMKLYSDWREDFHKQLAETGLLKPLPSDCNYFLCEVNLEKLTTNELYSKLLEQNVHIRLCDSIPGMPENKFIRLAVLTPNDNAKLIKALSEIQQTS